MNLKNKTYMRSDEFKARQLWLPFSDAVGIVLEVLADLKEKNAVWLKTWIREFRTRRTIKKQEQLKLNFLNWIQLSHAIHAGLATAAPASGCSSG